VTPNAATASALRTVQEASIVSPATPVQHAGLAALAAYGAVARHREHVAQARAVALPALVEAGLLRGLPQGGWYALVDLGPGIDGGTFAAELLRRFDVAVAPADGFALRPTFTPGGCDVLASPDPAAKTLVRVALCGDSSLLGTGVARLLELAAETAGRPVARCDR